MRTDRSRTAVGLAKGLPLLFCLIASVAIGQMPTTDRIPDNLNLPQTTVYLTARRLA